MSDLLAALRSLGSCEAASVLEAALRDDPERSGERTVFVSAVSVATGRSDMFVSTGETRSGPVQNPKVDIRIDSNVCDSGVELSTA